MGLFLPCVGIELGTQENIKNFQLITFLCIFGILHKYIMSKCKPQSTAKKCLDAHMLKIACLTALLNWGIVLEGNVYRFRPSDIQFLTSAQEHSDLGRVMCFCCCTLVTVLLSGVLFKKSTSPGSLQPYVLNAETSLLLSCVLREGYSIRAQFKGVAIFWK